MTARTQRATSVTRSLPAVPATAVLSTHIPSAPPTSRLESDMHSLAEQMARSHQHRREAEASAWRLRRAALAARRAEAAERRARLAREAAVLAHQSALAAAR